MDIRIRTAFTKIEIRTGGKVYAPQNPITVQLMSGSVWGGAIAFYSRLLELIARCLCLDFICRGSDCVYPAAARSALMVFAKPINCSKL